MYLCDKYEKHDWYPVGLRDRARVNEYCHWQHLNLRAHGSMLFRTKVQPRLTSGPAPMFCIHHSDHYSPPDRQATESAGARQMASTMGGFHRRSRERLARAISLPCR